MRHKHKAVPPKLKREGPKAPRDPDTPEFTGFRARMRLDRPGRKHGGRVGADLSPLSGAARRCDD